MKKLLVALSLVLAGSVFAGVPELKTEDTKMYCAETNAFMQELKVEGFHPMAAGTDPRGLLAFFMDEQGTVFVMLVGEDKSCLLAVGDDTTPVIPSSVPN